MRILLLSTAITNASAVAAMDAAVADLPGGKASAVAAMDGAVSDLATISHLPKGIEDCQSRCGFVSCV
ncbi:MAG: uncharacterized protein KVP18_000130 [Porospora cf. gigantea A]|uniref:uncharacterized protein n=1 Tax=Porospora cf. gigantea A TaxID=2853593 RepID=UPI0035599255|nr:MAG: hypothetical protein KVP18_000130 [Porospora cf. gigantea A]